MLSRRRFIGLTLALAAAPASVLLSREAREPWVPDPEEVQEWFEYYKLTVRRQFHAAMDLITVWDPEDPALSAENVARAHVAYESQNLDRSRVGLAHYEGYQAGRDGAPRVNEHATASNTGYSWYNGWEVGATDREWRGRKIVLEAPMRG